MGNIKKMSVKLANMIAAGEVVERPLNIVKEVVENSIDAKSSKISIYLKNAGLDEIKIIDDGIGMDEEDIKLCFLPHATSKVTNEYDLFRINTLGFRGEALASIASVSEVSLTSKTKDNKAYNIVYKFGNMISFSETASNVGTSITISKLFYNTPARLKYLKTNVKELAAISALVDKLALSMPNIAFSLYNDDKLIFKSDGKNNMTSLIGNIYGLEASKKLVEIPFDDKGFKGKIYYIKPEIYRSNKNQLTYIINNRYVKYYLLNDIIIDAFKGYLPINKYPILVLYLEIEPLLIDVNIHPKKEEVKIAEPNILFDIVYKLLRDSLVTDTKQIKSISYTDNVSYSNILEEYKNNNIYFFKEPTNTLFGNIDDNKKLPDLNFIGFFLKTYILCESDQDLYILDQHACAERIRYEYYSKELANPKVIKTSLLVSLELEFTKEEKLYLESNIDIYNELGFSFKIVNNRVKVLEIPMWASKEIEDIIREILKCIIDNKNINILDYRDEICKQISCKASIRAYDKISKEEVLVLIEELKKCENPYHCPHGRPTIIKFTKKELEKMFVRIEG